MTHGQPHSELRRIFNSSYKRKGDLLLLQHVRNKKAFRTKVTEGIRWHGLRFVHFYMRGSYFVCVTI